MSQDCSILSRFGFSEKEISSLAEGGFSQPTEFQTSALHATCGDGKGASLLAPTSSGKTFLFVPLAMRAASAGGKALLVVSTRAQVREIERRYFPLFEQLGYLAIATDKNYFDFRTGNFTIAVGVYESIYRSLPALGGLICRKSLIVCDEIDLLYDSHRGRFAEPLLQFAKASPAKTVYMSALLQSDDEFVHWLGMPVISSFRRAVNLRVGSVTGGRFDYTEVNSNRSAFESLLPQSRLKLTEHEEILRLVRHFYDASEATLVFLKDRESTRRMARYAVSGMTPCVCDAIVRTAMNKLDNTYNAELLKECIPNGIAFHNSDLTNNERSVVEDLLSQGRLLTVFCTPTLGTGVNFPITNVIVETHRWESRDDRLISRHINGLEFASLAGRAARLGMSRDEGRAMFVATTAQDMRARESILLAPKQGFGERNLGETLAETVFRHLYCIGPGEIEECVRRIMQGPLGIKVTAKTIEGILASLSVMSFLIESGGKYRLSRIGNLCAESGLSLESCTRIVESTDAAANIPLSAERWYWEICGMSECRATLPCAGGKDAGMVLKLLEADNPLHRLEELQYGLEYSELRRLKGAITLFLLGKDNSLDKVEREVGASAGVQQRLAGHASKVSRLAAEICRSRGTNDIADVFQSYGIHPLWKLEEEEMNDDGAIVQLEMMGQGRDRSGYVSIDGQKCKLRLSSYSILEDLVRATKTGDGWIRGKELTSDGDADRARKYISQLRTELRPFLECNPIENDGEGCYRLSVRIRNGGRV